MQILCAERSVLDSQQTPDEYSTKRAIFSGRGQVGSEIVTSEIPGNALLYDRVASRIYSGNQDLNKQRLALCSRRWSVFMLTLPRALVDLASRRWRWWWSLESTAVQTTTATTRGYKVPLELGSSAIKVFCLDEVPYVWAKEVAYERGPFCSGRIDRRRRRRIRTGNEIKMGFDWSKCVYICGRWRLRVVFGRYLEEILWGEVGNVADTEMYYCWRAILLMY